MAARRTRRKKVEAASVGLEPAAMAASEPDPELEAAAQRVVDADGAVLGRYRDPLGGRGLVLAALPVDRVEPTPFQRDLSEAHAKRLADVIERVGIFLDPLVAVPAPAGAGAPFWTPNGLHRLTALRRLGARSVTVLLCPDPALAYRILALNTEKAHNVRERALEALRMARGLAEADPSRPEGEYALELEEGALVTLGFAYETKGRFAGGAWAPALRASDGWIEGPIADALRIREAHARRLLALDERVGEIVAELRERGLESPYLRNFVVARLRPFRRRGQAAPPVDALLDHMERKAASFDASKVRSDQLARSAGSPAGDE